MGRRLMSARHVDSLIQRLLQSGALPEDEVKQWRTEHAVMETNADVRRRAAEGSGEDAAELAQWRLRGTHDESVDIHAFLKLAVRAARDTMSGPVSLHDERYASPRAGAALDRLLSAARPAGSASGGKLSERMRRVLVDWLVEVQVCFQIQSATLHLAVYYLDRYLVEGTEPIDRRNLQLLGVACLRHAEQICEAAVGVAPIERYASYTDSTYTVEQIEAMGTALGGVVGAVPRAATSRTYLEVFNTHLAQVDAWVCFMPSLFSRCARARARIVPAL